MSLIIAFNGDYRLFLLLLYFIALNYRFFLPKRVLKEAIILYKKQNDQNCQKYRYRPFYNLLLSTVKISPFYHVEITAFQEKPPLQYCIFCWSFSHIFSLRANTPKRESANHFRTAGTNIEVA